MKKAKKIKEQHKRGDSLIHEGVKNIFSKEELKALEDSNDSDIKAIIAFLNAVWELRLSRGETSEEDLQKHH